MVGSVDRTAEAREVPKSVVRMLRVAAPAAAMVATGIRTAWASAADGNSRVFELARGHASKILDSYSAYQSNNTHIIGPLRDHAHSLIHGLNQTMSKAVWAIGDIINNPLISSREMHWKGYLDIVLIHDGVFNVCKSAIRQIGAGIGADAPYRGWNWAFHMKLMGIAESVMSAANSTNHLAMQNETLNRIAEYCNSTILNYSTPLIVNMTTLRV